MLDTGKMKGEKRILPKISEATDAGLQELEDL
jgi:hypothetical protein